MDSSTRVKVMRFLLSLAWRDLRGGSRSLWLFGLCLVLGVTLIAATGTLYRQVSGALLADVVQDKTPRHFYPEAIQRPLSKFELGRFRRLVMPIAYAGFALSDR